MLQIKQLYLFIGFILALGTFTELSCFAQEFTVPPLERPVQDEAKLFSPEMVAELSQWLREIHSQGGPQIQVLAVDSLNGVPVESASIKVVEAWKLGGDKLDNGILLLISKSDRKIRLEVGQGLEGDLPDVVAKRIIARIISPLFKSGQLDKGLYEGIIAIVGYAAPQFLKGHESKDIEGDSNGSRMGPLKSLFLIGIFLLFFFFNILSGGLFSSRRFRGGGGFYGGGGFGGGGRSSGGWSGGGGGFSGGGASGDW